MAVGILLIVLGLLILVNGFNGNLAGLFQGTTVVDVKPVVQTPGSKPASIITGPGNG